MSLRPKARIVVEYPGVHAKPRIVRLRIGYRRAANATSGRTPPLLRTGPRTKCKGAHGAPRSFRVRSNDLLGCMLLLKRQCAQPVNEATNIVHLVHIGVAK